MCFFHRPPEPKAVVVDRYRNAAKQALNDLNDEYAYTLDVMGHTFKITHASGPTASVSADNKQDFWLGVVASVIQVEERVSKPSHGAS
ncbi:MAG: hypothetical protein V4501_11370 [Pseudomonadota bacterium]